ncbi:glycosyltransferase family 2 protein [Geobacter luticola]|uniref:Glycosyltransferase family 2 protein n=1 Tax=Geomobilimonas luticola TaxID=1114878 RepID=A0ABS5SCM2_9BACT|nr:glycosyltransferase family 2 protein [Geomobilimonas luticola]MBT0653118.1 glycosyltransferase family 2 protein [Geomobilimonas luticola]
MFSAIITVYNKEKWVARSVTSVLNQAETNLELIIVDDGSTDGSMNIVSKFDDPRIKIVRKSNGGLPSARNAGIEVAEGSYIAFLDADDEWLPWHLTTTLKAFESHPDAVIVGNRYIEIQSADPAGPTDHGIACPESWYVEKLDNYIKMIASDRFLFWVCSGVIAKSALDRSGELFDTDLSIGEDLNFFIRMSLFGDIYLSDVVSVIYHRCDNNSMMNYSGQKPKVTPDFFKGVSIDKMSKENLRHARKFMFREHLKRGYQNRSLTFSFRELSQNNYVVAPGATGQLAYVIVRFMPEFLLRAIISVKHKFSV